VVARALLMIGLALLLLRYNKQIASALAAMLG
jgi:hypothetical protein